MTDTSGPTIHPAEPDDWPRIAELRHAAFRWRGDPDALLAGMWVLIEEGKVQACARLEPEGQWFGGRAVPTGLVSSVAVAPDRRGRGLGTRLLRAVLHEARQSGLAAVTLYPSAVHPYRRAGFEIGGVHLTLSLPASELPSGGSGSVSAMGESDLQEVIACYGRVARGFDGAIARSEPWWRRRILSSRPPSPNPEPDVYAYVVREGSAVRGFIVYTLRPVVGDTYGMRVACRDLAWEHEGAARSLLGLVSGGRPHVVAMEWSGAVVDPLVAILAETPGILDSAPWMHRVLDPVRALVARGYPPAVRAELAFRVQDSFEPGWGAGVRVRIADGVAEVEEVSTDDPVVEVGTLSAILAGSLHPQVAARLGRLLVGREELDAFGALFPAGPRWIGDRF